MKMVNDVLGKTKGEDKINDILTGKGSFSKQGFGDVVNAMVNDTTFKLPTYGKDGKVNGEVNISEMIRNDLKKTLEKAKYPQRSESGVIDTCEIVTTGLAEAIPHLIMEQIKQGKKFDMPVQSRCIGSVYLADVPAKTKEVQIRDPKTQENLGSATIKTEAYVQLRAKSPAPAHLQTKIRKDVNGNVIQ